MKDLEKQQELKIAHMHLKEHQETIDKFRESVSEKTTQISDIQKDLNKSKDELQEKVYVVLWGVTVSKIPCGMRKKMCTDI